MATTGFQASEDRSGNAPGDGDCWNTIGISGDQTCPELTSVIHCRNCPVFAAAARTFFDRPAPLGYLADWTRWLGVSASLGARARDDGKGQETAFSRGECESVVVFRLGQEWLALRTQTVVEVTLPRPVHRVPHRSNQILAGLVNLGGQAELCVSLHGLLGIEAAGSRARLIVMRDCERAEKWVFTADEVMGVHRVPRTELRGVPATLANPAVGFSQAVFSSRGRSIGLLDEQRVFAALRSLGP